ncbi:MAG: DUF3127 domain-containing protein [Kiritimatiellia bacterium]
MTQFEMSGKVTKMYETQTFSKGFTKREFVVQTDDKFPQSIKFECIKERLALLDSVREGDTVNVQFRLRGSEYQGKYYVNLQAVGIAVSEKGAAGAGGDEADRLPPEPEGEGDNDGMPF